ncbi:MAG: GNAT family protein [Candidatus Zixiibacteriota bacterium]
MIKKIEGTRINLRVHRGSDAVSIFRYASDEAVSRYTFIPHPYTIRHAHDFIKLARSTRRKKLAFHFGIEDKQNGEIIGGIGLEAIDHFHHKGEIGYWLATPYWRQGIMTEAVNLILGFCFCEVNLHRVYAHVFPENAPSSMLLEKVGFTREGLLRQAAFKNGTFVDNYIYSILEHEWRQRRR